MRFRHWAVLTVVNLRDRRIFPMPGAAAMMCLTSPRDVLSEGLRLSQGAPAPQGVTAPPSLPGEGRLFLRLFQPAKNPRPPPLSNR